MYGWWNAEGSCNPGHERGNWVCVPLPRVSQWHWDFSTINLLL